MNFDVLAFAKKWWPLVVIVVLLMSVLGSLNTNFRMNRQFEIDASVQYLACKNELSTTLVAFNDKFGIWGFSVGSAKGLLEDVVSGRYDNRDANGVSDGTINTSLMMNVIVEAYPDVAGIYDFAREFSTWAGARRESFGQCQDKLIGIFGAWDKWNSENMFRESVSGIMGFPDEKLKAPTSEGILYGQAAWDEMQKIILYKGAIKAYDTHELEDITVPTLAP